MGHCAFMKKICALSEDECEEGKWKVGCEEEDHDDHDGHDDHQVNSSNIIGSTEV